MGAQPSRIHTPAVRRWINTVYHNRENLSLQVVKATNLELKGELKKEANVLTENIKEAETIYRQLKFPSEKKTQADYDYWIKTYPTEIKDMISETRSSDKDKPITDTDIKNNQEFLYKEVKQNIGFNALLEPGIQLAMVKKVQEAQEQNELEAMRTHFKDNMGSFWGLATPLIKHYQLEEFPEALAMFREGNFHRL